MFSFGGVSASRSLFSLHCQLTHFHCLIRFSFSLPIFDNSTNSFRRLSSCSFFNECTNSSGLGQLVSFPLDDLSSLGSSPLLTTHSPFFVSFFLVNWEDTLAELTSTSTRQSRYLNDKFGGNVSSGSFAILTLELCLRSLLVIQQSF